MSLSADLLMTYRAPRRVIRRLLEEGQREDRLLFHLMLACGLVFLSQWPALARQAALDPSVPLEARLGGALLAWLCLAPLILYLMAALSHLVARAFGGRGSWYGARLALFWSLLATAPLFLLHGLIAGYLGKGTVLAAAGLAVLAIFCIVWLSALREAESDAKAHPA
jgi:hypothetical protein